MDNLVKISNINDYLFCPFSIYLHSIYSHSHAEVETYQQVAQIAGKDAHASIDQKTYSTHSDVILSLSIISYEFELIGVIDQLFVSQGLLVERKNRIHTVFLGQKMQLFAQYICLTEMGYLIKS